MAEVQARSHLKKLFKVDPDKAWGEIQAIRVENGGVASPKAIVDRARPKRNPLHKAFEWDDTKAAEEYRKTQARSLVHSFELLFEDGSTAPAMVSVRVVHDGKKRRGFMDTEEAVNDRDLRVQVLKSALSQLMAMEKRFATLSELAGVFGTAREVAEQHGIELS